MGYAGYGNNSQQDTGPTEQSDPKADLATEKNERRPGDPGEARKLPAAGPHAKPGLTSDQATPGAGTLPEAGECDATDSTSG
ncbi:hypothetical protein [Microvirga sp. 2TAF3]|uniref:hypothetical protein n=1 Tax=Microvirga sp. 2TAF3 TaxID=3233014 RepID=UPI003F9E68CA